MPEMPATEKMEVTEPMEPPALAAPLAKTVKSRAHAARQAGLQVQVLSREVMRVETAERVVTGAPLAVHFAEILKTQQTDMLETLALGPEAAYRAMEERKL